jgi:ComF family protein
LSISNRIVGAMAIAANHVAAALLPQDCFLCGQPESPAPLCPSCRDSLLRLTEPCCPTCAAPTPLGSICGACLKQPPHFDATIALYRYAFPVDKLVQALKYAHRLALVEVFAEAMLAGTQPSADAIVPLPLSLPRLRQRGFNQAVEIARPLARQLGLPLLLDVCHRPLDTPAQASLPWQARRKNVRGAFECTVDLTGRSIAVVDDVMTTGATLDEFAKTLKRHGASRVTNWVVARTLKD